MAYEHPQSASFYQRLREFLGRPVDVASLVVFRVLFGAIMLIEVFRYFGHDWVARYYIYPEFFFKYYGFEWVQPWGGDGMYWHFALLGVLAVMVLLGLFYRVASVLLFFAFCYICLLDQTRYLNHFYLTALVAFIMCLVPANRAYSLDSKIWPARRSERIPAWAVWLLVAQFEIVYFYAGLVKLNSDWLQLQPLTMWLAKRQDLPLLGALFAEQWAIAVAAWGTVALHMIGAPLLLWRKTRPYIFVLYVLFHLSNHAVWEIGIFPWLTIAGTLMFFDPDWPRRIGRWVMRKAGRGGQPTEQPQMSTHGTSAFRPVSHWLITFLAVWLCYQVLMPLRHFVYPGDVAWTEEGHRFAWRMKLRDKNGKAYFTVSDPATDQDWEINPRRHITRKQASVMACRPDMILQFAHHLAEIWRRDMRLKQPQVRADVECSLNGRPKVTLIDPQRDLAGIPRTLGHADWILPLDEPLPPWPGGARKYLDAE